MRQLLPYPDDKFDALATFDRTDRQPTDERPWVAANMILSVDGAYAATGASAPLGGPADKDHFHLLRATSDMILVGAGTARNERYRRPSVREEWRSERDRKGLDEVPRLIVISRSLSIPADQPFLEGTGPDPLVIHPQNSTTTGIGPKVELRACGEREVDLRGALKSLRDDGASLILCEGGPRLLGDLAALNLIDEIFITIAPILVGGPSTGMLGGVGPLLHKQKIHHLFESDGYLFATYRSENAPSAETRATG